MAGDWIQMYTTSGRRLYKNLFDVNSDGSGKASLTVWPRLRDASPDGAALVTSGPTGVFRLAANVPWKIDVAKKYAVVLHAVESIF